MNRINVSLVSYFNSSPFLIGLQETEIAKHISLSLDIPAVCADKLQSGKADIGLIPIVALRDLPSFSLFSDYCIGADGEVNSVFIFSQTPIQEIKTLYLDPESRTSNKLAALLCKDYWKIDPVYKNISENFSEELKYGEGFIQIGDRTFGKKMQFAYNYDLAFYWKELTGLPFVFAVWSSTKPLEKEFIQLFNNAMEFGLSKRKEIIAQLPKIEGFDYSAYLFQNIKYDFGEKQKEAMRLFLDKV